MINKKTTALIGAGRWGKNLAKNFYALGALHTICDTNEALLDNMQESFPDVNLTSNFHKTLDSEEIEQIVIAAPAFLHYSLAKRALLAGKDLFVEKPLCLNSKEAEELVEIAEHHQKILMCGHLLHYHPCIEKLKTILAESGLGSLYYIASNRLNLGDIRTEENALWNFAPHDISLILSLCGDKMPTAIECQGGNYVNPEIADTSLLSLTFVDGIKAHIYASWLFPFKEQRLVVTGSDGMIVFDDTKPWEEKLAIYRHKIKKSTHGFPEIEKAEREFIIVPKEEPLRRECAHFLKCCTLRKTPKTDGREALRVVQVLEAAESCMVQKTVVV